MRRRRRTYRSPSPSYTPPPPALSYAPTYRPKIGATENRASVPAERENRAYFDSTAEFVKSLSPSPSGSSTREGASEFYGDCPSYPAALDLAANGWPAGRARVEGLTGDLIADFAQRITREEWVPDVVGYYADIGRIAAEEPECMMRLEEVESREGYIRPRIKILMHRGVMARVDADVVEARGAAVAALVDLLELAGCSVSVTAVFGTYYSANNMDVDYITIKPENERADASTLIFWLAHPSAQRRLHFARREQVRNAASGGYGCSMDPDISEFNPDIYIAAGYIGTPAGAARWTDLDATRRWLEDTLGQLGVKLSPKREEA